MNYKQKNFSILRIKKDSSKMTKKYYRTFGMGSHSCRICSRRNGLVRRLKLFICRQCFKENAEKIGFSRTI